MLKKGKRRHVHICSPLLLPPSPNSRLFLRYTSLSKNGSKDKIFIYHVECRRFFRQYIFSLTSALFPGLSGPQDLRFLKDARTIGREEQK